METLKYYEEIVELGLTPSSDCSRWDLPLESIIGLRRLPNAIVLFLVLELLFRHIIITVLPVPGADTRSPTQNINNYNYNQHNYYTSTTQ